MVARDWSSLPADLVTRVADCLLATNDLDCYTDLRAVCQHWRSSTADPASNQHDPRFRPRQWVMLLDEEKASSAAISDGDKVLFVNTATGRFLRRSSPLLRDPDYAYVTSTTDGLLVLAASDPPHAVVVLNPFTGSLIRFAAPMPSDDFHRFTAVVVGSSPTLALFSVVISWLFWADPQSEAFSVQQRQYSYCPASRLPLIAAGKFLAAVSRDSVSVSGAKNIFGLLRSEGYRRCYAVVDAGGDMLAVLKRRRGMDVFKVDSAGNVMESVKSIGSLALFLGIRCLAVDTDCFPTVEANCAYTVFDKYELVDDEGGEREERCIYKYNIGTNDEEGPELVSTMRYDKDEHMFVPCSPRPFMLLEHLSNYTMDIPWHSLTWDARHNNYVNDKSDEYDEEYQNRLERTYYYYDLFD